MCRRGALYHTVPIATAVATAPFTSSIYAPTDASSSCASSIYAVLVRCDLNAGLHWWCDRGGCCPGWLLHFLGYHDQEEERERARPKHAAAKSYSLM